MTSSEDRLLVGRGEVLGQIDALIAQAAAGVAQTVLVSGNAGIGKTTLVEHAIARADPGLILLRLPCLPLRVMTAPLQPLRSALRSAAAPESLNRACLDKIDAGDVLGGLDDWLDQVTMGSPVAVLVDDVQWADPALLDVLLSLVAGPADRRVVGLITQRSEGRLAGDPLDHWLADVLRLPRVHRIRLGPLDRSATEMQIASLLKGAPHQSLVDETFAAAHGHPYLTALLVRDLNPAAKHLPADLPSDLRVAVSRAWHACSSATRAVMSLLAVGGRPLAPAELQAVADTIGLGDVEAAVQEAEEKDLLDTDTSGRSWFAHPLQAQVLEQALSPTQRRRWHAAYAERLEKAVTEDASLTLELASQLADRHHSAGHPVDAYRWAVRSLKADLGAGDAHEQVRLARLALDLRPQLPAAVDSVEDLLIQLRHAAERAGSDADELAAIEELLLRLDRRAQPLQVAELLVRRCLLRMVAGLEFFSVTEMRSAVELAVIDPDSWQYALALAELAHASAWAGDPEAAAHADEAVRRARAAGDPTALAYACVAKSMCQQMSGQFASSGVLATEGVAAAEAARNWLAYVHAVLWECNAANVRYGPAEAEHLRLRADELAELGAPRSYVARLATAEADAWLMTGNWRACTSRLRLTFGSDPGPFADAAGRLVAARLAAWQGHVEEASAHLSRADELYADSHAFRSMGFDAVRSIVRLAEGRPEDAYQAAMVAVAEPGPPVELCEWLLPLAASALADLAEVARDAGNGDAEPLGRLERLRTEWPVVLTDAGDVGLVLGRQRAVLQNWYDAETQRAYRDRAAGPTWLATRDLSAVGMLPWLEVYAGWRAAEALLTDGAERRPEGVRVLRAAHERARQVGTEALATEIETLARTARVRLIAAAAATVAVLPGLTSREREILEHLVGGATYAEIAGALVISEKTVSSHVSNLLRKTGTRSRVELSRLAVRVARG